MIKRTSVRQCGFTLIEMMVVVLIIGILSAVAFPSYVSYVQKSRRFEAQAEMYKVAAYMEGFYTSKNAYKRDGSEDATFTYEENLKKYYVIDFSERTSQAYTIRAVPQGAQGKDECGTMTLAHTGAYTPATKGCWK